MKKLIMAVLTAVTITTGVAVSTDAPVSAAIPCVTRREWNSIHVGLRLGEVMRRLKDDPIYIGTDSRNRVGMTWTTCWHPRYPELGSGNYYWGVITFRQRTSGSSPFRVIAKRFGE